MKHSLCYLPKQSNAEASDSAALMALVNGIRHYDLRRYCVDQITAAESLDEVRAAVTLVREVAQKRA